MTVTEKAHAKINLYLDVLDREANGYHGICSVMQTIGLFDTVTLTAEPAAQTAITLQCGGEYSVPANRDNLAWRAAEAYCEAAACRLRIAIAIEKHIPVGGGMAGGSADAAAVLRGLDRLCGSLLGTEALCRIGASLGADIPFCLVGGTRLCRGRGERMTALPAIPPCGVVLFLSGETVSTGAAYAALDHAFDGFADGVAHASLSAMLASLEGDTLAAIGDASYNIFESVILPDCPRAAAALTRLREEGAAVARMSGSGPTVFGLFPNEEAAARAAARLGAGAVACGLQ